MTIPIQGMNRGEMRRIIGPSLGICQLGASNSTTDTSSLIDTLYLHGADNEHNGKQVMIYDATGSIADGSISFVSDYDSATQDATCSPVFSASITSGDKYELWKTPWLISDVNSAIDEAILKASARCLQVKQTEATFTKSDTYQYNCLSGFKAVHKVEYEDSIGTAVVVDDCETVWTAGTNVTASLDTTFKQEGNACVKLVVAAGAAAGAVLGYGTISAKDISGCDKVEISLYSTIALTAGYLDLVLDDTAACVSATESLDIPAMAANTWYRHIITLANPLSDTAIISVGLVNTTDVGACTLYVDYIRAVDSMSRNYAILNPQQWGLVKASTPLLQLTSSGLGVTGTTKLLRINGLAIPAMLTDDTTDSEVDPDYIINMARGLLMTSHAKSSSLDFDNRQEKGEQFMSLALERLNSISYSPEANERYL